MVRRSFVLSSWWTAPVSTNVTFNLGARVTWYDIGGFRSEWRNDITLFSNYGLRSEYYHPFTPTTHWFIAPKGTRVQRPRSTSITTINSSRPIAELWRWRTRRGLSVRNAGELRVGYEGGWEDFSREVGNPNELPSFSGGYAARQGSVSDGSSRQSLSFLARDKPSSRIFSGRMPILWRQISIPSLEVASRNFFKLNEPSSVFLNAFAGTTFQFLRHRLSAILAGWLAAAGSLRHQ